MSNDAVDTNDDRWPRWVLDISSYPGVPVFCPLEDDGTIVVGMNLIGMLGRGRKVIGAFSEDGQDAVEAWFVEHESAFKVLQEEYNV